MKKYYLIILLLLVYKSVLYAQDPLLKHYTSNDGLASSTIYRIIQDKDGFIWFATDAGVTRFDGKKFENYTLSDGLSDNEILALKEDSKGRIWFMGFNGTVSYWLNNNIYNSNTDPLLKQITTSTSFIDFFEDNEKRLWFISQSENTIVEDNKVIKVNRDDVQSACIVLNSDNCQLILACQPTYLCNYKRGSIKKLHQKYHIKRGNGYCLLKNGSLLFPNYDGIILQKDTQQKLLISFDDELIKSPQFDIELDANKLLWMTTTNGVYCYDYNNLKAKPIVYLKNKMSCNLLSDKEGNIWIGTLDDGLYMIPAWGLKISLIQDRNDLLDNQCFTVGKIPDGKILVGLNKGRSVMISRSKISAFGVPESKLTNERVQHIVSRNDNVWIASDCRFTHYYTEGKHYNNIKFKNYDSTFQLVDAIKDISLGKDNIYIARSYSILEYHINDKSNKISVERNNNSSYYARIILRSSTRIYSVFSSHSDELWYGSKEGLKSIKNNRYINHSGENILLSKRINAMTETEDSILIIATHGYGILFYKSGKILQQLTAASGLSNDICRRVYIHKNKIYVATPSGVSIILYKDGNIQNITNLNTGNFLHFNDVYDVYADIKEVCIATMNGLVIIKQDVLENIKPVIPILKIKSISVNDSIISPFVYSNLDYNQNSLAINFIGIYYQVPDDVNYRYRLKEGNTWIATKSNVLEFPYLPPAEYYFEIQARVKSGDWSEMKRFSFTINAPFWQRNWFILLLLSVAIALIYLGVKYRLKAIRKQHEEKARIEKQISDLEQQALQTMMNPHFIFNVMNSIQYFINNNDKKAANQYLSDFAKLIRMNLTISYKRYIPLDEEIDYLRLYLSFEKLRFGDKLTYDIFIDPLIDASDTPVAVMMIQPFLENAIWHGILPLNTNGNIKLAINKESDELLKIIITDDGVGIKEDFLEKENQHPKNESHGLSMTIQRLKLLGNMSGHELYIRFSHLYHNEKMKGTKVEMLLPTTNLGD